MMLLHRNALRSTTAVRAALANISACAFSSSSAAEPARYQHDDTLGRLLQTQLDDIHAAGTYKKERVITSGQESEIRVQGRQGTVLNMCGTMISAHTCTQIRTATPCMDCFRALECGKGRAARRTLIDGIASASVC